MNIGVKLKMGRFKTTIFKAINGHQFGVKSELKSEDSFNEVLRLETKRSQRSKKPPLLMLLYVNQFGPGKKKEHVISMVESILVSATREIDIKGWYKYYSIFGVLFTETEQRGKRGKAEPDAMIDCVRRRLCSVLADETVNTIKLLCYPLSCNSANPALIGRPVMTMSEPLQ